MSCTEKLTKQVLGAKHPNVATSLNNVASVYIFQGKNELARKFYLQALTIAETTLGENHSNTNIIRESLDYLRKQQQDS
ncbi:MAG: tetratricopeptide repeat protein [Cyanobacteria bacterium J06631_6]